MPIFLAAVAALLILSATLAHKLHHPADHLGLHAARRAVTTDMRSRVAEQKQIREAWKVATFTRRYGSGGGLQPLTDAEAREAYGRFVVAFPRLTQTRRSA